MGWKRTLIALVAVVSVVAGIVVFTQLGRVERTSITTADQDIQFASAERETDQPDSVGLETAPTTPEGSVSVLIVGTDDREGLDDLSGFGDFEGARADVVIQAIVDGPEAQLISIPRDLLVEEACGTGPAKVAELLEGCGDDDGPATLVSEVQQLTGIGIQHYVEIDFEGFSGIVDRLGGYEICVDNDVRDTKADLALPAGCTLADGDTTLAWLRSRKTEQLVDGSWQVHPRANDLLRAERQRLFLSTMLGSVTELSPIELVGMFDAVADHLRIDDGLSVPRMIQLASVLGGTNHVTSAAPPVRDETVGGVAYLVPTTDVRQWVSDLRVGLAASDESRS